ncbi:hypothetical protein X744_22540 [Mesorhizobium sp. LNJC372A00]|nr:hypothetical protein X744_22540 [Mesorhizobium sp. LNJC372A00]
MSIKYAFLVNLLEANSCIPGKKKAISFNEFQQRPENGLLIGSTYGTSIRIVFHELQGTGWEASVINKLGRNKNRRSGDKGMTRAPMQGDVSCVPG